MNIGTKIIIYNERGDTLYSDVINSPFLALQTGEAFWYGDPAAKKWATLLKVIYGLNTTTKEFVVTLYVQESEKKSTKEFADIDIGDGIVIKTEKEDWINSDRKLRVITEGMDRSYNYVKGLIVQLEHNDKIEIVKSDKLYTGGSLEVKIDSIRLRLTLVKVFADKLYNDVAEFRLNLIP